MDVALVVVVVIVSVVVILEGTSSGLFTTIDHKSQVSAAPKVEGCLFPITIPEIFMRKFTK